jgi:predicted ATPase
MRSCGCTQTHAHKRIVLTGGPGSGKTAILELVRHFRCEHIQILPEAASILFGGGFPRGKTAASMRAAQRAIYLVQRELETACDAENNHAIVLCDRGTVDGYAYWPGGNQSDGNQSHQDFWESLGTSPAEQYVRYAAVIHLEPPTLAGGYNHQNPVRIESAEEAQRIDALLKEAWAGHPRRIVVPSATNFLDKAFAALEILNQEIPSCCRTTFHRPNMQPSSIPPAG